MKNTLVACIILVTAPVFMNASCKKTTASTNKKCDPNVICTMIYAMVTTQVQDKNGQAVKLDEYYTVRTSTGEKIKLENQVGLDGHYTVLDDSYQKNLQLATDNFKFIGIKDGREIVSEPFTISADCCHIQKKAGRSTIVIP